MKVKIKEEVEPRFRGAFYADVANYMKVEISLNLLYRCAQFFREYPDLFKRLNKTKLTPTHYFQLATSRIPKETREKLVDLTIEKTAKAIFERVEEKGTYDDNNFKLNWTQFLELKKEFGMK